MKYARAIVGIIKMSLSYTNYKGVSVIVTFLTKKIQTKLKTQEKNIKNLEK